VSVPADSIGKQKENNTQAIKNVLDILTYQL